MPEPMSLMEFLQELLSDSGMRAGFLGDPHGTLAQHGLADLSPADVHDALVLVDDVRTADFAPYGDPYGGAATAGPPPPPDGHHADAVQYLSGYLTGTLTPPADPGPVTDPLGDRFSTGYGEDVDSHHPAFTAGLDDSSSFGSGDPGAHLADHHADHHAAAWAPVPDDDLFGHGTDVDAHMGAFGDASPDEAHDGYDPGDPYPDADPHDTHSHDAGGSADLHHDIGF